MMEKKQADANLPPSYMNLGFDHEPTAGPSAPKLSNDPGIYGADGQPIPGPSAPRHEDPEIHLKEPTAPRSEQSVEPTLQCNVPSLAFEDVYEACISYVKDHCCYSSKFAKQMKLAEINNGCAFQYILESFGEKRESSYSTTSYSGGSIDGPSNGTPPLPWDMTIRMPTLFKDSKTWEHIPHTESVEDCWCTDGKESCYRCSGRGTDSCSDCRGTGRIRKDENEQDERCSTCDGSGDIKCSRCDGTGKVTCSRCDGYGKVKRYKVLTVTWKNHVSEYISNIRKLPVKKFKEVTGDLIFIEQKDQLLPIANAPDVSVNVASTQLLQKHETAFPQELIRKQRHQLKAVPFTIIKYLWDGLEGEFYIYGKEKVVYFEQYPTDCCCCVVL